MSQNGEYDAKSRTLPRVSSEMDTLIEGMHRLLKFKPVAKVEDDAA